MAVTLHLGLRLVAGAQYILWWRLCIRLSITDIVLSSHPVSASATTAARGSRRCSSASKAMLGMDSPWRLWKMSLESPTHGPLRCAVRSGGGDGASATAGTARTWTIPFGSVVGGCDGPGTGVACTVRRCSHA